MNQQKKQTNKTQNQKPPQNTRGPGRLNTYEVVGKPSVHIMSATKEKLFPHGDL